MEDDNYSDEEVDELPALRRENRPSRRTSALNPALDGESEEGVTSPQRRASGAGIRDKMAEEIQEMQNILEARRMSQMNRRQSLAELIPGFPQLKAAEKKKVEKEEFKQDMEDVMVKEGAPSAHFRCVFSKPSQRFRWLKNKLEIFQGPKYNFINNGCEYILEIKKVGMEDAGLYTCKINDDISTTAALDVEESEKTYTFNQKLPDTVHVVRGKDLNLECSVNDPRAHVDWYRKGEKLEYTPNRYEIKRRENRCILRIVKARDEDEVEFGCTVEGDETYTEVVVDEPNWFFNRGLREQECMEGDKEVTFDCEVNDKDAEVRWFFCSDPEVDPLDLSKLQLLEEGENKCKMEILMRIKRKLTIYNLTLEHDGVIIARTAKNTTVGRLEIRHELLSQKERYKGLSEELDQTFAELTGY